jgi:magnesium transporter
MPARVLKKLVKKKRKKEEQEIIYKLITLPHVSKLEFFRSIPINKRGFVLLKLPKRYRREILQDLSKEEIVEMLHYLDPDETVDLLQSTSRRRRGAVLKDLSDEIRHKVAYLLKFKPSSAAGIMSLDYIEVNKDTTFEELSELVQKHEKRTGKFPTIFVVQDGFLVGELEGHVLALHKGREKIAPYIKKIPTVKYNESEEQIIRTFEEHPHNKVAVLDEDDSIMGVIYSDDVLKLIKEHEAETLYDFAGVSEEEDVLDPALVKVRHRYKWLIINLGTAFLAASVVGLFQDVISAFVLLAVYMPIVAGMGGNAGTQTLAVVVRGLALREINWQMAKRVIVSEVAAGAVNGAINGAIVAGVAMLLNHSPMLGLVVAIAMVLNLIIAGFFGTVVPLLMKRLGKDPASSATIFITTATDVCGFFAFLGLASLFLKL